MVNALLMSSHLIQTTNFLTIVFPILHIKKKNLKILGTGNALPRASEVVILEATLCNQVLFDTVPHSFYKEK